MNKEIENLARQKTREIFKGEHGNRSKGKIWVCGYNGLSTSKKTKCQECNETCYYDTKLEGTLCKNHKKICLRCVLKNHRDEMTALEIEIAEKVLKIR